MADEGDDGMERLEVELTEFVVDEEWAGTLNETTRKSQGVVLLF